MMDVNVIKDDGFLLTDRGGKLLSLTLLSLRIALKAYFSTYQSMKYRLHLFDSLDNVDEETIDFNHFSPYFELYAETIVHFQHFAELVFKDFLRAEHPLLTVDNVDSKKNLVILHKILRGDSLSTKEERDLKTIGLLDALDRITKLIEEKRIRESHLVFVREAKWLEQLNSLRNSVWHRGTFILRYPALDRLVGEYILPFVNQITNLPEYADQEGFWKYPKLKCGIDPIENIIDEFKEGRFDIGKIALLKELGRAAYENPIKNPTSAAFLSRDRRRAERIARAEQFGVNSVKSCPVCGADTLVVYDETEEDPFSETRKGAWQYTYRVKCMFCTFEINHHLKNPSEYGLPIEDYWSAQQM